MTRRCVGLGKSIVWVLLLSTVLNPVEAAVAPAQTARVPANKKDAAAPSQTARVPAKKKDQQDEPPEPTETKISTRVALVTGVMLAFNSGYINGCCLSGGFVPDNTNEKVATSGFGVVFNPFNGHNNGAVAPVHPKQAVAAVTGSYTTSALGLASGNISQFRSQIRIVLSYIFGSTIAGLLNPSPVPYELSPFSGTSFCIGALLMFISSNLASKDPSNMLCYYFAAAANGLQNSVTSAHTSNLLRTTHYTGMSSDIGTFLGQMIRGNEKNVPKLVVFMALGFSFWLGGFIAFFTTRAYAGSSLMFSVVLYATIGCFLTMENTGALDRLIEQLKEFDEKHQVVERVRALPQRAHEAILKFEEKHHVMGKLLRGIYTGALYVTRKCEAVINKLPN